MKWSDFMMVTRHRFQVFSFLVRPSWSPHRVGEVGSVARIGRPTKGKISVAVPLVGDSPAGASRLGMSLLQVKE